MHWLDRVATSVMRRPRLYPQLFPDGWGHLDRLDELMGRIKRGIRDFPVITPDFHEELDGERAGSFETTSDTVDDHMRTARLAHIAPHHRRQVILLAANNDHTFETRRRVAERLDGMGIGSLILEHPFYGERRRHEGPQPVRTVVDFVEMGIAATYEGVGVARWLASQDVVPGVAGFSQGGSNTAVVGCLCPEPIALAPMAASHSSSPVFTEGPMSEGVDWEALGGPDARHQLREVLSELTILNLPAPEHTATAVVGIGRGDGYVPEKYIKPVLDHWPGSEPVYLDPGHAGFHLWGKQVQADIIERAFDRFERAGYGS